MNCNTKGQVESVHVKHAYSAGENSKDILHKIKDFQVSQLHRKYHILLRHSLLLGTVAKTGSAGSFRESSGSLTGVLSFR
jgi:hypothetical protein